MSSRLTHALRVIESSQKYLNTEVVQVLIEMSSSKESEPHGASAAMVEEQATGEQPVQALTSGAGTERVSVKTFIINDA